MKNRPKIALIRPLIHEYINSQSADRFESSIGLVPPLNLCCIAAEIEMAGYEVSIHDCEANNNSENALKSFLDEKKPDIVGISIITTNFRGALKTAGIVRRNLPEATVICGGTHMMIFPSETFSHPEFDFGFIGEAEKPLVEFLEAFQKESRDYSGIPGLVWRNNDTLKINEPFGFNPDLDRLPFPAYHLLDISAYRMPNSEDNIVSLFLSRGCPFNCHFCFRNPQLKNVRFKSIDRIMEEINHVVTMHNIKSINFVDETISLKKDYFLEFCERLSSVPWELEWQSPTRVTSIDGEIVRAARKSGCHTLRFGIESGSEEILKKINKGITLDKSREAVRLCRENGIKSVGYFIIGYIGETEHTIKQTIKFARSISPDYAAFFPATPMPATELCRESEEKGQIPMNYWRDFVTGETNDPLPFIFPDAGKWTLRAYRQFYFSPSYILRQMKTVRFYKKFFYNLIIALKIFFIKFKRDS